MLISVPTYSVYYSDLA